MPARQIVAALEINSRLLLIITLTFSVYQNRLNRSRPLKTTLFDLRLLVHHMFPNFRIKLFDLHLLGHGSFVFRCSVKVPGSRGAF